MKKKRELLWSSTARDRDWLKYDFHIRKKKLYTRSRYIEPESFEWHDFQNSYQEIVYKKVFTSFFIQKLNCYNQHTKIDFVILNQERYIYNKTACLPGTVVQPSLPSGTTSSPLLFCLLRLLSRPPVPRFAKLYSWFLLTAWEFSRW